MRLLAHKVVGHPLPFSLLFDGAILTGGPPSIVVLYTGQMLGIGFSTGTLSKSGWRSMTSMLLFMGSRRTPVTRPPSKSNHLRSVFWSIRITPILVSNVLYL